MLALLYSVQSIPAIQQTPLAIPVAQLYLDAVGQRLTCMCLVVVAAAQFMAAVTAFTASSRLIYALARDDALPGRQVFMKLNRQQAPYWGVWISVLVGCAISCAYIGSSIAFNAILSSAAVSVMLSYMQPIIIRVVWPSSLIERGPFHLVAWSWPVSFAGLLVRLIRPTDFRIDCFDTPVSCFNISQFAIFVCILFVLPTAHPSTALNMNYAVVAVGGLLILTASAWLLWGHAHFSGPVKTIGSSEDEGKSRSSTDVDEPGRVAKQ